MSHNNVFLTHLNSHVSQQSAFNASFFCLMSKVKYFPMTSCDPSLKRRFESYVTDGTKTHFCEFEFGSRDLKVTAMPRCSAVNISSFPWTRIWIFRTSPLQIGSLWKSRIRWMTTSNFWFAPLQYFFLKLSHLVNVQAEFQVQAEFREFVKIGSKWVKMGQNGS